MIHEGKPITLSGVEYTLPTLPLSGIAKMKERLKLIGSGLTVEAAEALVEGIYLSLRRSYPQITTEEIDNGIDRHNYGAVLDAFVAVNYTGIDSDSAEGKATAV